jgi:hypothetical protein
MDTTRLGEDAYEVVRQILTQFMNDPVAASSEPRGHRQYPYVYTNRPHHGRRQAIVLIQIHTGHDAYSQTLHVLVRALMQAPFDILRKLIQVVERVPRRDLGRDSSREDGDDRLGEQPPTRRADRRCCARASSHRPRGPARIHGGRVRSGISEHGQVGELPRRARVAKREEPGLQRAELGGRLEAQVDVVARQRGRFP